MNLYTDYDPKIIPVFGDSDWAQIDRVQTIDKTGTINKTEVKEVGSEYLDYVPQTPAIGYRMTQREYGSLVLWEKLANKDSVHSITLNDFKTSAFDICAYITDDDGTFIGTTWLPKLRLTGFSISIGDPNTLIDRSFDFVGEDWIHWQGSNKYLIYKEKDVESGDLGEEGLVEIVIEDPVAVKDPNSESGEDIYILRVVRVRAGVATELTTDDYSYSEVEETLSVESCQAGDVIKYWYTGTDYIDGEDPFEENPDDLPGIHASAVTISLESESQVRRIQSVTIDVRFDRQDLFEIGNSEIVQRGIRNKTVTITLGRLLENTTIEEVLADVGVGYGKLDIREFGDNFKLKLKIFSDKGKGTFKIGYCATELAPSEIRAGTSVDNYTDAGNTLTGKFLTICSDETTFDVL